MAEDLKTWLTRLEEEIWGQGNLNAIDELFAPDYIGHYPYTSEQSGTELLKCFAAVVHSAFSDISYTIHETILEGDRAVQRWTLQGVHQEEFMGITPKQCRIALPGITILRLGDKGKVVEVWSCWDRMAVMEQLQ